jgi:hypothetical protein
MANTLVKGMMIGCGVLALLGGGLAIFGGIAFNRFGNEVQSEASKPVDKAALLAALGDTPIYPGAEFSEMMTQAAIPMKKILGFSMKEPIAAGFDLKDPVETVEKWYEKTLPEKGFTKTSEKHFSKGSKRLVVAVAETSGGPFLTIILGDAK